MWIMIKDCVRLPLSDLQAVLRHPSCGKAATQPRKEGERGGGGKEGRGRGKGEGGREEGGERERDGDCLSFSFSL